ncbi:MAG: response regulator [Chloroflexi bacterium]|nr:response regulator [Chloroflexota bacterium]
MATRKPQPVKAQLLIVDDEAGIRDMFQETLEECGYACLTAPSGEAALEVLANNPVDLLLLDILMPKMSGLACFEHVKERYPDVAVIFVTAMDDVPLAVRNMREGAFDYLVKPMTAKLLEQAVEEALARRSFHLAEKKQREILEKELIQQLDQRGRELASLNVLFQQHLKQHFAVVEAYRDIRNRLTELMQHVDTQYQIPIPPLPPELMDSLDAEGGDHGVNSNDLPIP